MVDAKADTPPQVRTHHSLRVMGHLQQFLQYIQAEKAGRPALTRIQEPPETEYHRRCRGRPRKAAAPPQTGEGASVPD